MKSQGQYQVVIGRVFLFALVLFLIGCDGSSSSSAGGGSSLDGPLDTYTLVVADAGDIVGVRVNQVAVLDGSGSSTTSTEPLTYAWSFSSMPTGSAAVLQGATSENPSFTPDVEGTYTVQLVTSAGSVSSRRAIATVEATIDGNYTGIRVHTSYSSQCAECHDGRFAEPVGPLDPVPPKSGIHPATTNLCQACHTTFGFELIRNVDHLEVFGNCSDCHDGGVAQGKSQFHVETNAECDNCHTTDSFLVLDSNGNFDHSGITRGCDTCHNGTIAIGMHDAHLTVPAGSDCSDCHTTDDFQNAYVDHSTITDNCGSCHNGTDATGPTVGHPVMSVDCGICHSTTQFSLDGVFNHRVDSAAQPCAGCHNDNNSIGARGKEDAVNHPPTTSDCGVCHGTGGGNFADGIYDHTGIVDNCADCHGAGGNGSGPGVTTNHIPIVADCSVCHTTGTFTTGVFDHDLTGYATSVDCTTCHNGVNSAGKHVTHIPTNPDDQNCADCHTGTDTFVGATFNHTGIDTSNCALCHDGNISTGVITNHIPIARDCSACHVITNFVDFTGATFDHLGVNNNCADCHDGTLALGKKVNHIPAQAECSQCHVDTNTGGFAATIFLSDVHVNVANGCEGCHDSQFFPTTPTVLKAATHLPTNQDCHFCHTTNAFTPHDFTHAGITDNCVSCHDGSTDNVAAGALGKSSDPTPPHPDTTEDCGVCHGVSGTFADATFDHTGRVDNCNECHADGATGAVSKMHVGHVPTTQDCSVCHVPGTFTTAVFSHDGIVDNCASCHDGGAATATVKPGFHLATTEDCSVCHNTTAFAGARFDHQGIVSSCATCHDGVTALGKDGNHVPTNSDCSVCHRTTGFIPGDFDHTGIVDNCQSCHDGALATGKPFDHVQTNQDCGSCHNTNGFIPATFDHSSITTSTRCDSCHGVTATGMDAKTNPPHIPTTLDCRSCHTTATFVGGSWVHDYSNDGRCDECHNSAVGATAKPTTGHISTDMQCDACHNTNGWAPTNFSHDLQGNYPGDHRRLLTCGACHGNIITTPFDYRFSQYAPFCAACHANDFDRKGDHIGGENGTIEQNKDCSGGGRGCHRVSDSNFD